MRDQLQGLQSAFDDGIIGGREVFKSFTELLIDFLDPSIDLGALKSGVSTK